MNHNKHPNAIVHRFDAPFQFNVPYQGKPEIIPELFVAYETWGDPSHPAILICHALTGNTHATDLEYPDDWRRSWWPAMAGPGRAIDTDKYYVICINMLGGCGGSSGPATINRETGKPYGLTFPIVEVEDMVRAQKILLDALGVKKLYAVIGGSMGGFQALVWAIEYPDFVERVIPVASSAYSNQFMIMTNRVQIDAVQTDLNYKDGHYHQGPPPSTGLRIARMLGHTTFISPITMEKKFTKYHQSQREPFADDKFHRRFFHEAENYLHAVTESFISDFDANSMVYLLQTWNHFDLAIRHGSLAKAMERVKAKMMVVSATGDNLFPPYLSEDLVKAMQVNGLPVKYLCLEEEYGHDFFLKPEIIQKKLTDPIRGFLEET